MQEQVHLIISHNADTDEPTPMACRIEKRKYYENKGKDKSDYSKTRQNTNLFCYHCKILGHTMERCWKLHGYPPKYKSNSWKREPQVNKGNANLVNTEDNK